MTLEKIARTARTAYARAKTYRDGIIVKAANTAWQSAVLSLLLVKGRWDVRAVSAAIGAGLSAGKTFLAQTLTGFAAARAGTPPEPGATIASGATGDHEYPVDDLGPVIAE